MPDTTSAAAPLIDVRGLSFARNDLPVFGPLDFHVERGEALLVQGGNGAGKTTLLRLLAGLLDGERGEIRLGGSPAGPAARAGSLAYLGPRVLAPAAAAVLVFGVWMVLDSSAWDFGQAWVLAAIGLFGLTFLVGAVYLSRVALLLVRASAADGREARDLLDRWIATYAIIIVLLLVAVWDMVFKPGA